jgi:hypothetical protein
MGRASYILCMVTVLFSAVFSEETESKGKFSGYMFGDYYHVLAYHNPDIKDQRGFWFRRIYLTYDNEMDGHFATRLRLEMSNAGDFATSNTMIPFVKDAYLQYKIENHVFSFGISQTPALSTVENAWGYRYLEKIPLDLYRMASSRDFGVAAIGKIDNSGHIGYHVMLSNGSGNKDEIDKGKSAQLSVNWSPLEGLILETFGEYADAEGIEDGYTWRLFGAYVKDRFRIGIEYADQTLQQAAAPDIKRRFLSAFVCGNIIEKISVILRCDRMFDPNPDGKKIAFLPFDPDAPSTFILAALEWAPVKEVCITPNMEFVKYGKTDANITPGDDLYGRLTFYWKFK